MEPSITPDHLEQFDTQGFFILEQAIPPADLDLLRELSDNAVAARMLGQRVGDREGQQLMNTGGGRYFIFGLEEEKPEIYRVLFADWVVSIISVMTDQSSMFHTEFVVKDGGQPEANTRFGWHQDGGYNTAEQAGGAGVPATPHISIWCALDDMSAANGGLRVLPFERNPTDHPVVSMTPPRPNADSQPLFRHRRVTPAGENVNNLTADIAGYFGDDTGDLIEIAAGGVVVFSALTLHGSGANATESPRRALNIAYSQAAFVNEPVSEVTPRAGIAFIEQGRLTEQAKQLRRSFDSGQRP